MNLYIIFSVIVTLGVVLTILKKRKTFFCLSNIINIVFLIIFIIAPVIVGENDIIYNEPLLYSLICSYIVLFFALYKNQTIKNPTKIINIERFTSPNKLLNFYLVLFIILIIYHIIAGNYNKLLTANIGANRLETYYEEGFNFLSSLLGYITMLFYITAALIEKNKTNVKKTLIIFLLIAIEVAATSEHRTPVITPILLGFIFYHLYVKKIPVSYFISIGVGVILFMSVSSYVRSGQILEYKYRGFSQEMSHGLRGLNTSASFDDMYRWMEKSNIDYEYGYQFYLDLITPIPRILWKSKPNVSFSSRKTEEMYGRIEVGNWVRTYTVWGEGYSQFGYIGVVLYSIFLVFILRLFIKFLSKYKGMEILLINYMIQLPFLIRADLFAVLTRIMFILIFLVFVHLIIGVKKKKSSSKIYSILIQ